MRGKGERKRRHGNPGRITPAYAGKSFWRAVFWGLHRDHPRVCGEKTWTPCNPSMMLGSPPRMRGKGAASVEEAKALRITPAYAGKSNVAALTVTWCWDHPRVCGEKKWGVNEKNRLVGSPPRMRGKGDPQGGLAGTLGITPAYAGKSLPCRSWYRLCGDHPRVCGEKYYPV